MNYLRIALYIVIAAVQLDQSCVGLYAAYIVIPDVTVLDDAVDFVKISEGMGAKAIRVTKMEEVEPAIREALATDGPVVLDCWIDQDLSVFPMVPAGASLNEVFDEEDMKNNEQSV